MITVGVTSDVDIGELEMIASSPDDVIRVDNFTLLLGQLQTLIAQTCRPRDTGSSMCTCTYPSKHFGVLQTFDRIKK